MPCRVAARPMRLHELLASDAYKSHIDWSRLHVFWGDERFIPFTDERNNAKMAFDTLLDKVPVPMKTSTSCRQKILTPEASAEAYEKILHQYFPLVHTPHPDDVPDNTPHHTFDLVILGMGNDGHTLSLFPGKPVIHEADKWVTAFYLDEQSMYRVTLTHPVVNHAACVMFLVAGSDKAAPLKQVLQGDYHPGTLPVADHQAQRRTALVHRQRRCCQPVSIYQNQHSEITNQKSQISIHLSLIISQFLNVCACIFVNRKHRRHGSSRVV